MRKISTLFFLIVALTFYGQTKNDSIENKLTINIKTVNQIYISAYCSPWDSCRGTQYQLNFAMTNDLIDRLNKSNSKNPCIFTEEYYLYIHFKDRTIKILRIKGALIKDNNDKCFDIKDSDYFENLWIKLDKEWIEVNKK